MKSTSELERSQDPLKIYNDNGYNIVLVQQLLQHSSAAVTQRYIGIRQQELEKAIEGHLMLEV